MFSELFTICRTEIKRSTKVLLFSVLIVVGLSALAIWALDGPFTFRRAFNTDICLDEAPDITVKPSSSPRPESWDSTGALELLRNYSILLNNDSQPMTADPNDISTITEWWQAAAMISWYLKAPLRHKCKNIVRFGNWAVCQDGRYRVKKPCLVYSFGINFDFRFDGAMAKLGCDVRSFDPSMGVSDHQHGPNITFYSLGLADFNTNVYSPYLDGKYVKDKQNWKVRTLKAIIRQLGHQHRVLDVLKLDIEGYEFGVIDSIIETGLLKYIRHFLVEYHLFQGRFPVEDFVLYLQTMTRLRQMGFREYQSTPHSEKFRPGKYNQQGEVYYINYHFSRNKLPPRNDGCSND